VANIRRPFIGRGNWASRVARRLDGEEAGEHVIATINMISATEVIFRRGAEGLRGSDGHASRFFRVFENKTTKIPREDSHVEDLDAEIEAEAQGLGRLVDVEVGDAETKVCSIRKAIAEVGMSGDVLVQDYAAIDDERNIDTERFNVPGQVGANHAAPMLVGDGDREGDHLATEAEVAVTRTRRH